MTVRTRIHRYMVDNVAYHVDRQTGEVNETTLAEDAAHALGHDEWLDDAEHFIWEMAARVADRFSGKVRPISRALGGLINSRESDWF
jgi:hypothetical protein